jgi:superfamily I DNA/RNA helicase
MLSLQSGLLIRARHKAGCHERLVSYSAGPVRALRNIRPTEQQLTVIDDASPGFWLIRGAAGSGKTTTAVKRMQFLISYHRERRETAGDLRPLRALLLTFNRTLCGYVEELARQNIEARDSHLLEIETFGGWANSRITGTILSYKEQDDLILAQRRPDLPLDDRVLLDEVRYVTGLYLPAERERYLTAERTGRGRLPPSISEARRRILELIARYEAEKTRQHVADWQDVAVLLAQNRAGDAYDIVVVDETQDFSANQVRAIVNHVAEGHTTTFVRDNVQRIYPHYFTWRDVGVVIPTASNRGLARNHRNTAEIAAFARPLVEGLERGDDGELPDFKFCKRSGPKPVVLRGRYPDQVQWVVRGIAAGDFGDREETIGFLHPKGWFRDLRPALNAAHLPYVDLTRVKDWPAGDNERIGLTTMHSAKGLEFDHVVILGYDHVTMEVGTDEEDDRLHQQRRMLAMSVGRALKTLTVGFSVADQPAAMLQFLDPDTHDFEDV